MFPAIAEYLRSLFEPYLPGPRRVDGTGDPDCSHKTKSRGWYVEGKFSADPEGRDLICRKCKAVWRR